MVTVSAYALRKANDGRQFITLELTGGVEFVQSMQTGKHYATVRRSSMATTFDETIAKSLVGSQYPGEIARVESEPYQYTIKETGEEITLNYSYQYVPDVSVKSESRHMQEA